MNTPPELKPAVPEEQPPVVPAAPATPVVDTAPLAASAPAASEAVVAPQVPQATAQAEPLPAVTEPVNQARTVNQMSASAVAAQIVAGEKPDGLEQLLYKP